MNIINQRVRLAVDTSQMSTINDVITGNSPQFWNGVDVEFEIGVFRLGELVDISNLDSITVDLKQGDPRTGLPLMSQTIASADLNSALTLDAWNGGASADCHCLAVFTNSETNLDLNADTETFWLVISALTNDSPAHIIEAGAGPINVVEGGDGVTPPSYVATPIYYTGAQSDARYTMSVNLTSINNSITTLNSEVATNTTNISTVTTTANNALPKTGGTMTGAVIFTGTGYAAITLNALTTTQRNALTPAAGNMIYNSTTNAVEYYNGSSWGSIGSGMFVSTTGGTMSGTLQFSGTTNPGLKVNNLTTTQINALTAASGMVVFNTTTSQVQIYNGTAWIPLGVSPQVFTVGSQSAMLALSANQGDIAVRTDVNQCFVLSNSVPATLSNWTQLLTPASAVSSVNSLTGAITLTTSNIGEGSNLYYTSARAKADAIAALLVGFTSATGGTVSASDSVVVAFGRLENRTALNDAKVTGSDRVLKAGDTMTGPLQFSGGTNPGILLSSLTDTQRAALTPIGGMIIFNSTLDQIEYFNGNAWVVLSSGAGTTWFSGSGAPSSSIGGSGAYYLNTANGAIYLNTSGTWAVLWTPSSLGASYVPLVGNVSLTGPLVWTGTGFAAITLNSLTTTQRNALTAAAGNVVFNTTTNALEYYNGTAWVSLTSGGAAPGIVGTYASASNSSGIGATTLYTTANDGVYHTYRITGFCQCQTAGSGTVQGDLKYTNMNGTALTQSQACFGSNGLNSALNSNSGTWTFRAAPNTAIQFQVVESGSGGSYAVAISLELLF